MAQKRKAKEAFGGPEGQLSAFAAAKLSRQNGTSTPAVDDHRNVVLDEDIALATGAEHYDAPSSPMSTSSIDEIVGTVRTPIKSEPVSLGTLWPDEVNSSWLDTGTLEVRLQLDETMAIVGEYDVVVASGIVTIYGTVLKADSPRQRVYAPSTHALPQVQARQNDTVIQISPVKTGLRKLGRLSPLFRNIWTSNSSPGGSFEILTSSLQDRLQRSVCAVTIDRDTDLFLRTLSAKTMAESRTPRVMVVGAKASGKSTLNRILCNHMLSWTTVTSCHYLDIDPGQPEFGAPGQLSLVEVSRSMLGPPFTHAASPLSTSYRLVRSHTIAATSFKEDPDHYRACVRDLAKHIDRRFPLIINSCGWVTGLGASILVDLIKDLSPSDVGLMEPLDSDLVESIQRLSGEASVHKLSRQPSRPSSRTPAEHRAIQTMAYFHSATTPDSHSIRWSGRPISRLRPWIVDYAGAKPGLWAILSYTLSPQPQFLSEVLGGAIVALTVLEEEEVANLEDHIDNTPEGLPFATTNEQGISRTLNPALSRCVGLALIRGIDTDKKQIHIITPLSEVEVETLSTKKVAFVRGSFDPPEWAYLEDLYKDEGTSSATAHVDRPWVSKKSLVGIEGAVWRLRHPPMASTISSGR